MKKYFWILLLFLFIWGFLHQTGSSQNLFLRGVVKWNTGTPALGLQIRLIKDGVIISKSYTNQKGRYVFFNIQGTPDQYYIEVYDRDNLLNTTDLLNVTTGSRVPDIIID